MVNEVQGVTRSPSPWCPLYSVGERCVCCNMVGTRSGAIMGLHQDVCVDLAHRRPCTRTCVSGHRPFCQDTGTLGVAPHKARAAKEACPGANFAARHSKSCSAIACDCGASKVGSRSEKAQRARNCARSAPVRVAPSHARVQPCEVWQALPAWLWSFPEVQHLCQEGRFLSAGRLLLSLASQSLHGQVLPSMKPL